MFGVGCAFGLWYDCILLMSPILSVFWPMCVKMDYGISVCVGCWPIEYGCVYCGILGLVVRMGYFVNGFHEIVSKTE